MQLNPRFERTFASGLCPLAQSAQATRSSAANAASPPGVSNRAVCLVFRRLQLKQVRSSRARRLLSASG